MMTMFQSFPKTGIGLEDEAQIQQISFIQAAYPHCKLLSVATLEWQLRYKLGLVAKVHFIECRTVFPRKGYVTKIEVDDYQKNILQKG